MSDGIDPVEYGALKNQVEHLSGQVTEMQADIKLLLGMANHSKGALWLGMGFVSLLSGVGTLLVERLFTK
jgi:hypothetical protein